MLADIVRAGSRVVPMCGGHERIRIAQGESASIVRHEDAETDSVHQSDDQDALSGAMESVYHGRNCTSVRLIWPEVAFESVIPNTLSVPSRSVCPVMEFGCVSDANAVISGVTLLKGCRVKRFRFGERKPTRWCPPPLGHLRAIAIPISVSKIKIPTRSGTLPLEPVYQSRQSRCAASKTRSNSFSFWPRCSGISE